MPPKTCYARVKKIVLTVMGVVQVDDVVPTVVVNKVDNRLVVLWPHTRGVIHQPRRWIRYLRESGESQTEREVKEGEGDEG